MSVDNYGYIVAFINLLGIAQGVFISIALLTIKNANRLANYLLAALLVSFAIGIAGASLGASGFYQYFPHFIRVGDPFVLLIGPLFFLYARTLTKVPLLRKDLLHFVPFILYVIFLIPFYSQTGEQKINFVRQMQESKTIGILFIVCIRLAFLLTYTFFTYRLLKYYNKSIKDKYSTIDKLSLDWLNQISILLFVVIVCSFSMYILVCTGYLSFLASNYIISLLLTIVIYAVGIMGIRKARLFITPVTEKILAVASPELSPEQPTRVTAKYENSSLSSEKASKYLQKLINGVQQDKLYLKPELSLQILADELDIPPHYLSQVINEQLEQNFFDFINSYRVEEVKNRLLDPKFNHLTILAIAYDSGFNSKSAFNLAFKNQTGITPSQFKAQHKTV